jgi:membrane-associated phospholipid phosphatase
MSDRITNTAPFEEAATRASTRTSLQRIVARFLRSVSSHPIIWSTAYLVTYLIAFFILDHVSTGPIHIVHMAIDDWIPFVAPFILAYLVWFPYWIGALLFFAWRMVRYGERSGFGHYMSMLAIGMTIFIITSIVYPNGLQLRPTSFDHPTVFTQLCTALWTIDSPSDVFPSIHVFNALTAHIAIARSPLAHTPGRGWVRPASAITATLIILSTMLVKQHSVFDVLTGIVMVAVLFVLVYQINWPAIARRFNLID